MIPSSKLKACNMGLKVRLPSGVVGAVDVSWVLSSVSNGIGSFGGILGSLYLLCNMRDI